MQSKKRLTLLGALIATALGAPLVADALPLPTGTIVAAQLKQPTTPVLGGVYTSPYPALIGPGSDTTSAQLARAS